MSSLAGSGRWAVAVLGGFFFFLNSCKKDEILCFAYICLFFFVVS
jgi:hypothetical protein